MPRIISRTHNGFKDEYNYCSLLMSSLEVYMQFLSFFSQITCINILYIILITFLALYVCS